MDVEVLPTAVHVVPSPDTEPITVPALRESFSQAGKVCDPPAMNAVEPPDEERVMNSMLPSGRTSRITCGESAAVVCRSMTPAFAYGFTFCSAVTRAISWPSPLSGCEAYWNASAVPQISPPAPRTLKVEPDRAEPPVTPTAPTSRLVQGFGSAPPAGGGGGGADPADTVT